MRGAVRIAESKRYPGRRNPGFPRSVRKRMPILPLLAMALVQAPTPSVLAQTPGPTVAIIPSVNVSGDKHLRLVEEQAFEGDRVLRKLFLERGFTVLEPPRVREAITGEKLDFTDEENFRKEEMYRVGNRAGADYVAFTAITSTMQKEKRTVFAGEQLEGWATVRVWVLDAKARSPIVAGKPFSAASTKNFSVGFGRQVRAVRFAIEGATKEGLKPYRVVRKVDYDDAQ